jgi:hypothetical protein
MSVSSFGVSRPTHGLSGAVHSNTTTSEAEGLDQTSQGQGSLDPQALRLTDLGPFDLTLSTTDLFATIPQYSPTDLVEGL